MAWRPPYQPQFGQTTCGSLACVHWGQTLRGGALSFQFEARRLRLFALDVFFLGTAMSIVSFAFGLSFGFGWWFGLGGIQVLESRPPGIGVVSLAPATALCEGRPTHGAQPLAILAAQRYQREFQEHGVACQRLQVHLVAGKRIDLLAVGVRFEQLPHCGSNLPGGRAEAANALPHPGGAHRPLSDDGAPLK